MNYLRFVELREPALAAFEQQLAAARQRGSKVSYEQLEELAVDYRQLLHDQALAAERFPDTAFARRLRRTALEATRWLHRDTGDHLPGLREFFGRTFPAAFQRCAPAMAVALALFLLMSLLGLVLVIAQPRFAGAFLPEEALAGLERGTLWTTNIFAVTPAPEISSRIATNNLSVLLTAWAGGALAGLGALWVVGLNGLMLGSVIGIVMHYSLTGGLLTFIAAHGPLEISLILVAAGAGLAVGQAMVVADDLPRGEALRRAGRDSLVVVLGCLPWIVLLGVVEGFVSPAPEVPVAIKIGMGLLLFLAFLTVAMRRPAPKVDTAAKSPASSRAMERDAEQGGVS